MRFEKLDIVMNAEGGALCGGDGDCPPERVASCEVDGNGDDGVDAACEWVEGTAKPPEEGMDTPGSDFMLLALFLLLLRGNNLDNLLDAFVRTDESDSWPVRLLSVLVLPSSGIKGGGTEVQLGAKEAVSGAPIGRVRATCWVRRR